MKVLWITNKPFPEVSEKLKLKAHVKGWVVSAASALLNQNYNIELAVASFYEGNNLEEFKIGKLTHYLLPKNLRNSKANADEQLWLELKNKFYPDVVHLHGSEYFHSYSFVKTCGADKVVLSIQGLVSVYERYYYGDISRIKLAKSTTLRDLVRRDTFFLKRKNMRERGTYEKLLIKKLNHVIGRTSWDRDHLWALNPKATYHFCNETLRPSFYKNQWSLDKCEKYSIFVSQAQYPIKGFHKLIEAMPLVLRHYPKTKIYVAGTNYFSNRGIKISGYGSYVNALIKKYNLSESIQFSGFLSEEDMCEQFLNCHISVCPSAIENSPNSVGEAQLLGVPCVASYVGGVADMVEHGMTGLLYRYEEVEMLAANICKLFSDDELAVKLSGASKIRAAERHNNEKNAARLYEIYAEINETK